jgi:hypothetical protein
MIIRDSFHFVNVVKHAPRDANGEHCPFTHRLMLRSSGDIHHDSFVNLDFVVVEHHRALAGDNVIDLIGLGVIVKLGMVNLNVVNLGRGAVDFFD